MRETIASPEMVVRSVFVFSYLRPALSVVFSLNTIFAVEKAAKAKGVETKVVTVKSDVVSDAIIAAAKKQNADLIVMASHGRKGIKRLLLGSETQQVLTHSHTPVLVLR